MDELDGVVESAVIGLPHPDFGESVAAVLVAEPGVDITQADVFECFERSACANFKRPKSGFYWLSSCLATRWAARVQKKVSSRAQFS